MWMRRVIFVFIFSERAARRRGGGALPDFFFFFFFFPVQQTTSGIGHRAFALTLSAKKTETMCIPPPRTPRTMVRIEAAGQIYKQVQPFTYYLGGAVTETPDMSVEIARRTRACWVRIRRALRPTESRSLSQDPDDEGRINRRPSVWMQSVDPPPGTLCQTSYRTPPGLASHHRSAAQETRPPDDLVQPCP